MICNNFFLDHMQYIYIGKQNQQLNLEIHKHLRLGSQSFKGGNIMYEFMFEWTELFLESKIWTLNINGKYYQFKVKVNDFEWFYFELLLDVKVTICILDILSV